MANLLLIKNARLMLQPLHRVEHRRPIAYRSGGVSGGRPQVYLRKVEGNTVMPR